MRYNVKKVLPLVACLLAACGEEKETVLQDSLVTAGPVNQYDLSQQQLPFPNDLLFSGSQDGTLNLPVVDDSNLSAPQVAINALDGFSTVSPLMTTFSAALDPATINGSSVRLYEVSLTAGPGSAVKQIENSLVFGSDYIATVQDGALPASVLVIVPLKPLKPKTSYVVVLTDALSGMDGKAVQRAPSYMLTRGNTSLAEIPPQDPIRRSDILVGLMKPAASATQAEIDQAYQQAATLELLRATVVNPSEQVIVNAASDISSADIILHWSFTTQSVSDVLEAVRTTVRMQTAEAGFTDINESGFDSPLGAATIKAGFLTVPYFLTASDSSSTPSHDPAALQSYWLAEDGVALSYLTQQLTPKIVSYEKIPMLVSIPKVEGECENGMPETGWPVVIYQHGITANRTSMLALADTLASACFAAVAIDLPMHGITGNETSELRLLKDSVNGERTFDLDLLTQDVNGNILSQTPDGIVDSSGSHFINLAVLLNTRDNVRQGIADLFSLTWAIESGVVTDGISHFNGDAIYFIGHSLGAMVGTGFVALESEVNTAGLVASGGSIAKLLDGSAAFGAFIAQALEEASGFSKGSSEYEILIAAMQTVLDSADPINHSVMLASSDKGILFHEMVGGGTANNRPDLVVPNRVPDSNDVVGTVAAPLAGTEPQLKVLGLTQQGSDKSSAEPLKVSVKFNTGDHSSLLNPAADARVTAEMQSQLLHFLISNGTQLEVNEAVSDLIIEPVTTY